MRRKLDRRGLRSGPMRVARTVRRIGVAIVGTMLVIVGVVLLPLPGPGTLIILSGLALIATEFRFAKQRLTWIRRELTDVWRQVSGEFRSGSARHRSHPHRHRPLL